MPSITIDEITKAIQGFQGAPTFSAFVETGTGAGDTIFAMEPFFDALHTVELSYDLHQQAKGQYKGDKIVFHHGDSSVVLETFLPSLGPTVFWLDGHYAHGITAKGDKDCPLLEELQSIDRNFKDYALIVIDDARLFGTTDPEDWGGVHEASILQVLQGRVQEFYYMPSFIHEKDRLVIHLLPSSMENYIACRTLGSNGRLGNAMFEYAAGKALAMRHNVRFRVPKDLFEREHHGQKCLLDQFRIDFDYEEDPLPEMTTYSFDRPRNFDPSFLTLPSKADLYGHFQTEKFFENISGVIRQEFQFGDEVLEESRAYLQGIRDRHGDDCEIVGLHMRRGDLIVPGYEDVLNNLSEGSWLHTYITRTMEMVEAGGKNVAYLVFSGGSVTGDNTEDMEWCKENLRAMFASKNIEFSENNPCIKDLAILTHCDHAIITCITSYSWWAGYLNPHTDAKIIVPSYIPFGESFDLTEFWATRFTQIDVTR